MKTFFATVLAFLCLLSLTLCSINPNVNDSENRSVLGRREREDFPEQLRRRMRFVNYDYNEQVMILAPIASSTQNAPNSEPMDEEQVDSVTASPSHSVSNDSTELNCIDKPNDCLNTVDDIRFTIPVGLLSELDYDFMNFFKNVDVEELENRPYFSGSNLQAPQQREH